MHTSFEDSSGLGFAKANHDALVASPAERPMDAIDTRTINEVAKDEELRCAYALIADLIETLNSCRAYIECDVDIIDGENGPRPNAAMRLVSMIDESIYGPGNF